MACVSQIRASPLRVINLGFLRFDRVTSGIHYGLFEMAKEEPRPLGPLRPKDEMSAMFPVLKVPPHPCPFLSIPRGLATVLREVLELRYGVRAAASL